MAKKGYAIILKFGVNSGPVDNTRQYMRGSVQNSGNTDTRVPISIAGTITKVTVTYSIMGTLGSDEAVSFYINKNGGIDGADGGALIATGKTDAAVQSYTKSVSIPVNVGDRVNIQYGPTTRATNPTNISRNAEIRVE